MNPLQMTLRKLENEAISEQIKKLFWIGAQWDAPELHEFLDEMSGANNGKDFARIFSLIPEKIVEETCEGHKIGENLRQLIGDYSYDGFIVELFIPKPYEAVFGARGKVERYKASMGHCRIGYAYGESPAQLVKDIIKVHAAVTREELRSLYHKHKKS